MSNEEKTILKNEEETYDSITPNDNISNQKNTNSTNNIKLSSENEDINNSVFKSVISNKFIEIKDFISTKLYKLFQKLQIESSYKKFLIFFIIGIIFIILSFFNLPLILLKPTQFLFTYDIGNIFIIISLLFYYGSNQFIQTLIEKQIIIILYILSIVFGLIFSFKQIYIISLFFSMELLIISIMFFLTFIPGGQSGIEFIKTSLGIPFQQILLYIKNI